MFHLPTGFGVPEWPMSFDHLAFAWVVVAVVLLSVALWLLPRWDAMSAGRWRRSRRRRWLRVVGPSRAGHRRRPRRGKE